MPSRKKIKKLLDGKCHFCGLEDQDLLDTHRIIFGKNGGRYNSQNEATVCKNCHAKIHAGRIQILGKHFCSNGRWVINYIDENGEEKFS